MPFVFQPTFLNDTYLVDGGVLCNYPLDYCIEDIVYYGYYMFDKLIGIARKSPKNEIKNEIIIPCDRINIPRAVEIVKNKEVRNNYIKKGEECAKLFLLYLPSREPCSKN